MKNIFYFSFIFIWVLVFMYCAGCSDNESKTKTTTNSLVNSSIKYPLPLSKDSLISVLKFCGDDTNRVNVLNALSWSCKNDQPDTAMLVVKNALELAKKLQYKKGLASSYSDLGVINYDKSDYSKALDNYFQALAIDTEMKNSSDLSLSAAGKRGMAVRYGNIGIVYAEQGDYPKALEYYLNALKIDEEFATSPDKNIALSAENGMARHYGNIGTVYCMQGDNQKGFQYYNEALKMDSVTGNVRNLANHLGNIANIYDDEGDYEKAIAYNLKELKIIQENNFFYLLPDNYCNIGVLYYEQKDYVTALDYFTKALKLDEQAGDKNSITTDLNAIGTLYISTQKYKDAYSVLQRAQKTADTIEALDLSKEIYQQLSKLFETSDVLLPDSSGKLFASKVDMRNEALRYFKNYVSLRDTLFGEENKKQLVQKEMNYEFEKKESNQKAEQDKKDAISKAALNQKEKERNYFIAGFTLVFLLAGFIFRGYRQKQKANEIIFAQKMLVEEKQKEIIDSIHYAKKIQQSLFPSEKYIEKSLDRLKGN